MTTQSLLLNAHAVSMFYLHENNTVKNFVLKPSYLLSTVDSSVTKKMIGGLKLSMFQNKLFMKLHCYIFIKIGGAA